MLLKDISPFVRQAILGSISNKVHNLDTFKRLKAPFHRLFYITDGNGIISVEGTEYTLKPGSAIIIKSGAEYFWNTESAKIIAISFDYTSKFADVTDVDFSLYRSDNFNPSSILEHLNFEDAEILNKSVYIPNASSVEYMLRALSSVYLLKEKFTKELLSSYMKSVITALVHNIYSDNNTTKNTDTVRRIISYIQANYSQNITNSHIAEAFHFNYSYVNRVFKKSTGQSIHKFLIDYRMDMAKELLRTENSSVTSIAFSVGYTDTHNFVKSFKRAVGKTPTEYRNQECKNLKS